MEELRSIAGRDHDRDLRPLGRSVWSPIRDRYRTVIEGAFAHSLVDQNRRGDPVQLQTDMELTHHEVGLG